MRPYPNDISNLEESLFSSLVIVPLLLGLGSFYIFFHQADEFLLSIENGISRTVGVRWLLKSSLHRSFDLTTKSYFSWCKSCALMPSSVNGKPEFSYPFVPLPMLLFHVGCDHCFKVPINRLCQIGLRMVGRSQLLNHSPLFANQIE